MADWQPLRDMRQYVFLDECGVTTDLLRRYGRSPCGTRLQDHAPFGHWDTHTVVAALRLDGLTAPAVFDGPIDNVDVRRLRRASAGPDAAARAMSWSSTISPSTNNPRSAPRSKPSGAQLRFLPPYSPDFNPIELAFAKLKAFLRAARPRTFDQVCALIAAALRLFTPTECRNFVRHCGYRVATGL